MAQFGLLLALFGTLMVASVPEAFAGSSGGGGKHSLAAHPRLNTAPSASGAVNSYTLNNTFDVNIQSAGTGPQNADFETAARAVGTAPANSGFETPPGIAGTPPTNYDFASGDFTGWTKTNEPTIASDQPHGSYAKLNGGTITSSPFTVDPGTQNLSVDVGYLDPGYSWIRVYILTGTGYTTQTQLLSTNCYACQYRRTETTDLSAYRGHVNDHDYWLSRSSGEGPFPYTTDLASSVSEGGQTNADHRDPAGGSWSVGHCH